MRAERSDTCGPTSTPRHSRWLVLHVASGLEHATKGTAQYAFGALAVAIDEGFGSKLLEAGHDFPTMSGCEFVELEGDDDAERFASSLNRCA